MQPVSPCGSLVTWTKHEVGRCVRSVTKPTEILKHDRSKSQPFLQLSSARRRGSRSSATAGPEDHARATRRVHRSLFFDRRPELSASVALLTVLSAGRVGTVQHVVDRSQRCTSRSASSPSAAVGDLRLPVVDRTKMSSASFGAYANRGLC